MRSSSFTSARKSQINPDQLQLDWNAAPAALIMPAAVAVPVSPTKPLAFAVKRTLRESVERFLRERGVPYINVDEAKKALFAGAKLRSFHFVVYRSSAQNWLVFAAAPRKESREDLRQWEGIFGDGFVAVIASIARDQTLRFRTLAGQIVELP